MNNKERKEFREFRETKARIQRIKDLKKELVEIKKRQDELLEEVQSLEGKLYTPKKARGYGDPVVELY